MNLLAAKAFVARAWPFLLAAAVGAILLLTYCEGRKSGTNAADKARLEGNAKAQEKKAGADAKAADARVEDAVRLEQEQTQLQEAVEDAKDPADARRRHYACLRLQQAARKAGSSPPACG